MSVRKLKDGRWVCQYYIKVDGRRKHKKEYFGRGPDAEYAAHVRDQEIKALSLNPLSVESPEFEILAKDYQKAKFLVVGAMSDTDKVNTYYKMRKFILPFFGHHQAMSITSVLMDNYVDKRSKMWADKAKSRKIKANTIHRELSIVKAVLNWAAYKRKPPLIPFNPIDKYEMPKRDDEIIVPPTKQERQRIYDAAPSHIKRVIILNYNIGARSGESELFKIRWEHVDFEKEIITIISAKKGGIKQRRVPISEELRQYLIQWRNEDAARLKVESENVNGAIIHYYGRPIKRIKKAWKSTLKNAGIGRRLRPYDLRHAFATDLLEAGGDLKTVSEILGHSRPDTTARIYQHTNMEMYRLTMKKLPTAIKNSINEENNSTKKNE